MHFHLTRREIVNQIAERYAFSRNDAEAITDTLEDTGEIEFSGAMFSIRNPTEQDAKSIEALAHGALGHGIGGAVSAYKVKEYLQLVLRKATTRPKKR